MEKDTKLLEKEVKTPAETDGDFKEDTSPKKTAMQELKDKIALLQKFSLAWTIISMIISTGFLIYSVFGKFGEPTYRYVAFGILGAYILVFIALLIFASEGKKKKRMLLKTYKTGIAVFKGILNIVYCALTITVLLYSFSGSETEKILSWIITIATLVFAVLSIVFKIVVLILSNLIPKLAKLGAQAAKEAIEEKINESPTLTQVVNYVKKRETRKKLKAQKKAQRAERKLLRQKEKEQKPIESFRSDVTEGAALPAGEVNAIENAKPIHTDSGRGKDEKAGIFASLKNKTLKAKEKAAELKDSAVQKAEQYIERDENGRFSFKLKKTKEKVASDDISDN